MTIFSKSPSLTSHLQINYQIGCTEICYEVCFEKNRDVSKPLGTSIMEVFVTLNGGFQLLTNFAKNSILGVMGVQDTSL